MRYEFPDSVCAEGFCDEAMGWLSEGEAPVEDQG
jgi:hypothetical protein